MLTLRGHDVHTADSLASAIRVAAEVDFDLLISDIELPDGTGLELMWTLRPSRAVPGIALSGFGSSDDIELSRSAGFAEHLTKPVDFRRLEEAIQQVAADSRAVGLGGAVRIRYFPAAGGSPSRRFALTSRPPWWMTRWLTFPLSSLTNVIVASTTLRKKTVSDSGKISNLGWSVT